MMHGNLGVSRKGKLCMCRYKIIFKHGIAIMWEGPIAYLIYNFWKPKSFPYMFSIAGVFAVAYLVFAFGFHVCRLKISWNHPNDVSFQPHGSHWKNPLGVDVTVPARKIRPTGRHGWGRCKSAAAHRTPPLEARKKQFESGFRLGLREIYGKAMAFFDHIQTHVGFSVSCPSTPQGTEELSQTLDLLNASVMAKDGKRYQASAQWVHICAMGTCVLVSLCMWSEWL